MFPCQRIIYSIGKELVYSNRSTLSLLRQNTLRRHSILSTNRNLNFISKPQQTNLYVLSSIPIQKNCNIIFCQSTCSSSDGTPQTTAQKLKKAVTEYGPVVIIFHISISLMSLGICYTLVSSGLDLTAIISYLGLDIDTENKVATSAGAFVVAYAVHKVFAPARIGVTLTAAPFIVKYLRKIGWLRQTPKKDN